MPDTIVIGAGPAGLSAALFLAKNGVETLVFDTDKTWMHKAHLFNYLGIHSIDGTQFLETAREQVSEQGADLRVGEEVASVESSPDGFAVSTGDSDYDAQYVVLATGANRDLAEDAGCSLDDAGLVAVDLSMESSIDDLYATGAMIRDQEWQAIISAGDGAAAALNILSKERGEHFHDFDTPADAE